MALNLYNDQKSKMCKDTTKSLITSLENYGFLDLYAYKVTNITLNKNFFAKVMINHDFTY